MNQAGLTDYELQRQERIRQNQERMLALNLPALAAQVAPKPKPPAAPRRGLSSKRQRLSGEGVERRKSARLEGKVPDGGEIESEGLNGKVVVVDAAAGPPAPRDRHPKGEVPFRSYNAAPGTDAAFLATIRAATAGDSTLDPSAGFSGASELAEEAPATAPRRGGKKKAAAPPPPPPRPAPYSGAGATFAQLCRASLAEEDVAKVTKDAITHMAFAPVTSALLLAAADKKGNIGLWNVDYEPTTTAGDTAGAAGAAAAGAGVSPAASTVALDADYDEFDGILSFSGVHHEYISGLRFSGGPSPAVWTCAYDGSLRRLDAAAGAFSLAWGDEEQEYSCFDLTPDSATAYVGDKDGGIDVIDLRARRRAAALPEAHGRKINTIHLDPAGGPVMVTSSTDTQVKLWDLRVLGAGGGGRKVAGEPAGFLAAGAHDKTCQAAYLAPDGSRRVVSTSFDNTVRIWDGRTPADKTAKELPLLTSVKHDCQTGRWVLPLRAVWGAGGDAVMVGSMRREVCVIDARSGKLGAALASDAMTAIPPRLAAHPGMPVVAAATGSGRVHVFRCPDA